MLNRVPKVTAVVIAMGVLIVAAIALTDLLVTRYSVSPRPSFTAAQARAQALRRVTTWTPSGQAPITGWIVTAELYEPRGDRVTDSRGRVISTSQQSPLCFLPLPSCGLGPVWEVELTAPGTGQWAAYDGIVVMDAMTSQERSVSMTAHR